MDGKDLYEVYAKAMEQYEGKEQPRFEKLSVSEQAAWECVSDEAAASS
jgi:hypothetical protein